MRILGRRASTFKNYEIHRMLKKGTDLDGEPLDIAQRRELKKVLKLRKEAREGK